MKRSMIAANIAAAVPETPATTAGAQSRPKRYREYRFQTPDRLTPFLATAGTMRHVRYVLAAFVLVVLLFPAPSAVAVGGQDITTNFKTSQSLSGWSAFDGKDASKSNIDFIPEGARLWVRNGKGAAMSLKNPIKYGEWNVKMKISGTGTKVCLLLWPYGGGWPPEIDFNESGDRTKSFQTMHYSSSNRMIQTQYAVDQTQWHVYGVRVTATNVVYTLDGTVMNTVTNMAPSQSWNMHIRTMKKSSGTAQSTQMIVAWASEDAW